MCTEEADNKKSGKTTSDEESEIEVTGFSVGSQLPLQSLNEKKSREKSREIGITDIVSWQLILKLLTS